MSDLIDDFVRGYELKFDFYERVAAIAAERCRETLKEHSIPAIISSRAKRPERLLGKLKQRNATKNYQTHEQIIQDVVDLSGVRISLYFPSQEAEVTRLLEKGFDIKRIKKLGRATQNTKDRDESKGSGTPYQYRFGGYRATHVRAELGEQTLPAEQRRYGSSMIEIQIASLLMHAWSEVEHDLAYKSVNGPLSTDELRILDGLNGAVRVSELMLGQLKTSMEKRLLGEMDLAKSKL